MNALPNFLDAFLAKINETDTFGPGDDDEIQFDDIGDDDEDIDDVSSRHVPYDMFETLIFDSKLSFDVFLEKVKLYTSVQNSLPCQGFCS